MLLKETKKALEQFASMATITDYNGDKITPAEAMRKYYEHRATLLQILDNMNKRREALDKFDAETETLSGWASFIDETSFNNPNRRTPKKGEARDIHDAWKKAIEERQPERDKLGRSFGEVRETAATVERANAREYLAAVLAAFGVFVSSHYEALQTRRGFESVAAYIDGIAHEANPEPLHTVNNLSGTHTYKDGDTTTHIVYYSCSIAFEMTHRIPEYDKVYCSNIFAAEEQPRYYGDKTGLEIAKAHAAEPVKHYDAAQLDKVNEIISAYMDAVGKLEKEKRETLATIPEAALRHDASI